MELAFGIVAMWCIGGVLGRCLGKVIYGDDFDLFDAINLVVSASGFVLWFFK